LQGVRGRHPAKHAPRCRLLLHAVPEGRAATVAEGVVGLTRGPGAPALQFEIDCPQVVIASTVRPNAYYMAAMLKNPIKKPCPDRLGVDLPDFPNVSPVL
jgi:hypothetical protein